MSKIKRQSVLDRDGWQGSITHDVFLENTLMILSSLSDREQEIARYRVGLHDGFVKKKTDVINRFSISQTELEDIESKILTLQVRSIKAGEEFQPIFPKVLILDLIRILERLEESEREILRRKWGLFDGRPWTVDELATEFKTSTQTIEDLNAKVCLHIRV